MDTFDCSEEFFRGFYHQFRVLDTGWGAARIVHFYGDEEDQFVLKISHRVTPAEEIAMKLVQQHTDVPVPNILKSFYEPDQGRLAMSYVPGTTLDNIWNSLGDREKEKLCHELWEMIRKIRNIPKPPSLQNLYLCRADGSPCRDALVANRYGHPTLLNDDAVRARIYERYYAANGRKYEHELPAMLPRSNCSVFSHADIAPRNIMCDPDSKSITALIDWERAGWYPDYWEYASIMRPSKDDDFQAWMTRTSHHKWDITGITAARGVLLLPG